MEKTKNCWVIPTDKPSRLWTNNLRRRLELDEFPEQHLNQIAKHIYITNDEEIKDGYYLDLTHNIIMKSVFYPSSDKNCKKIILTTDPDLDGVQKIDDEFLEWFVKNPSCEWVEVDLVSVNEFGSEITVNGYGFDKFIYKITIPKEEPTEEAKQRAENYMSLKGALEPKQESLEEVAHEMLVDYGIKSIGQSIGVLTVKKLMVNMAKWQAERMYSEEEVIRILDKREDYLGTEPSIFDYLTNKEWFEQFKKK